MSRTDSLDERMRTRTYFRLRDDEKTYPASVYRIYDEHDRVIYIGCADDVLSRISMHRHSFGMPDAALLQRGYHRHDAEEFATRAAARAAERAAIAAERPWINRHHNPTRWRRDGKSGPFKPVDVAAYVEFALSILGPRNPRLSHGIAAQDAYTAMLASP